MLKLYLITPSVTDSISELYDPILVAGVNFEIIAVPSRFFNQLYTVLVDYLSSLLTRLTLIWYSARSSIPVCFLC